MNLKTIRKRFLMLFTNPKRVVNRLLNRGLLDWMPDKPYLELRYRIEFGRKLDLKHPRLFSEKLQWLKLYDRNPLYTKLADKYEVREWVAERIGASCLIPLLGVWERPEDVDYSRLPAAFVLKCTHDSGGVEICRDQAVWNRAQAEQRLRKHFARKFYYMLREWPYKNIKPRIIAEQYLSDDSGEGLRDYKFYCFSGQPRLCQVIGNRDTRETIDFFDMDWQHLPFSGMRMPACPNDAVQPACPEHFGRMNELAQTLAKDLPFVRVDLYSIRGSIYFGEMTFYPYSGFGRFSPDEWNTIIGDMLTLPEKPYR